MNCEEALVLLSGYLDGTNTEEEMTQLRAHLEQCPDCRQVLHTLEEMEQGLASLEEQAPADLKASVMEAIRAEAKPRKKHRRWMPVAVAAALVLVVGVSQFGFTEQENAVVPAASSGEAVPAAYSRSLMDAPAAQIDTQTIADERVAYVVLTRDMLPEMDQCACETLVDGTLLYRFETAEAADQLSEKYGLELFCPYGEAATDHSYARLIP